MSSPEGWWWINVSGALPYFRIRYPVTVVAEMVNEDGAAGSPETASGVRRESDMDYPERSFILLCRMRIPSINAAVTGCLNFAPCLVFFSIGERIPAGTAVAILGSCC